MRIAREAVERRSADKKVWGIIAPPKTHHDVRVFGLPAFIEATLKLGLNYLNYHGSDAQSQMPTGLKIMWTISYLSTRFNSCVQSRRLPLMSEFADRHPEAALN